MGSKWDIEKFTGSNDFGLWKLKMRAFLIQQKCVEALKGEAQKLAHVTPVKKTEINDKAVSAIILCFGDTVLREVSMETPVVSMCNKLNSLYMTKSLAHRQYMKQLLYFYRMVESKPIVE